MRVRSERSQWKMDGLSGRGRVEWRAIRRPEEQADLPPLQGVVIETEVGSVRR